MKDGLNGITALNLLGSEQRLLPTPTDLILRNADENEIDEIDESQGVNNTLDKSHASLSDRNIKFARRNIRSLPLKNCSAYKWAKTQSIWQTRTLFPISKLSEIFPRRRCLPTEQFICSKQVKVPFQGIRIFIARLSQYNPADETVTQCHPDGNFLDTWHVIWQFNQVVSSELTCSRAWSLCQCYLWKGGGATILLVVLSSLNVWISTFKWQILARLQNPGRFSKSIVLFFMVNLKITCC